MIFRNRASFSDFDHRNWENIPWIDEANSPLAKILAHDHPSWGIFSSIYAIPDAAPFIPNHASSDGNFSTIMPPAINYGDTTPNILRVDPDAPTSSIANPEPQALVTAPVLQLNLSGLYELAGLIGGTAWGTSTLSYSFPDTLEDWVGPGGEGPYYIRRSGWPDTNEPRLDQFGQISAEQMSLINKILDNNSQSTLSIGSFVRVCLESHAERAMRRSRMMAEAA